MLSINQENELNEWAQSRVMIITADGLLAKQQAHCSYGGGVGWVAGGQLQVHACVLVECVRHETQKTLEVGLAILHDRLKPPAAIFGSQEVSIGSFTCSEYWREGGQWLMRWASGWMVGFVSLSDHPCRSIVRYLFILSFFVSFFLSFFLSLFDTGYYHDHLIF